MLTRSQKEVEVAELHDRFTRATSVFVAEYRGLDVASVDALRAKMRAAGAGRVRVSRRQEHAAAQGGGGFVGRSRSSRTSAGRRRSRSRSAIPRSSRRCSSTTRKDKEPFKLRAAVVEGQALEHRRDRAARDAAVAGRTARQVDRAAAGAGGSARAAACGAGRADRARRGGAPATTGGGGRLRVISGTAEAVPRPRSRGIHQSSGT